MKFVDEAIITVESGKGGDGCLSFRREKSVPKGGPDGGNGGNGGDIYVRAEPALNTLADFRYTRRFKAENGKPGAGQNKTGRSGADSYIDVPVGTMVFDHDTGELIGDLAEPARCVLVAYGGHGGLGNAHFKSSTNRAPRRITRGRPSEVRDLRLELRVLADIGLLGLPNAGKSTLLSAISEATPKIAEYPFTTLHPQLGVVRIDHGRSFVVADIPGLIEGAADGMGLGIRFLKHLSRTRLLLHLVDISPVPPRPLVQDVQVIEAELTRYRKELRECYDRWLVLNKIDLLEEEEGRSRFSDLVDKLDWTEPAFMISAATGQGCDTLCRAIMNHLEKNGVGREQR